MSLQNSKAFKIGLGIATGGVAGGAMALAQNSDNKSLGGLASLVGSMGGGKSPDTAPADPNGLGKDFSAQGTDSSAARRMSMLDANRSPEQHIDAGIEALGHPDVQGKIGPHIAAALHGAKTFQGPHPLIDQHLQPWLDSLGQSANYGDYMGSD